MSIRDARYWEPILDLRVFRGFPSQVIPGLRDRVTDFEIEEHYRKMDVARLTLDNSDGRLIDVDSLPLGIVMKVTFGYPGTLSSARLLECRKITGAIRPGRGGRGGLGEVSGPHTAAGGALTMQLRSREWELNRLRIPGREGVDGVEPETGRQLRFTGTAADPVTVPKIVRELARRNGFRNAVVEELEDEPTIDEYTIPTIMSDFEWIQMAAKRRDWTFTIDDEGFKFKRPGSQGLKEDQTEPLSWFAGDPDVIEWELEGDLNIANLLKPSVVDKERVYAKLAGAAGTRLAQDLARNPGADPVAAQRRAEAGLNVSGAAAVIEFKKNFPDATLPTRSNWRSVEAVERLINQALNRFTLKLKLVGNPRVRADRGINLRNFGPMIDGDWWCRVVKHSVRPNQVYITEVEAKRRQAPGKGIKNRFYAKTSDPGGKGAVLIVETNS